MTASQSEFSLGSLWLVLKARSVLILLFTLVCAVAVGILSLLQSKIYSATAHLLVSESKISDPDATRSPSHVYYELLRSYETLISNDHLIQKTVQNFGLDKHPYDLNVERFKRQRILKVELPKSTRLFKITVQFPDARLSAGIANFFADKAVASNEEMHNQDVQKARGLFRQQLNQAEEEVKRAEENLLKFTGSSKLEQVRQSVSTLVDGHSRKETELTNLIVAVSRSSEKENSQSEIRGLKAAIQAIQRDLEAGRHRLNGLLKERASKEVMLDHLSHQLETARRSYDSIYRRYQDAATSVKSRSIDVKVIAPAVVPQSPIKPRIQLNILLACLLGFLVSLVLVFVLRNLEKARMRMSTNLDPPADDRRPQLLRSRKE